MKKTIKLLIGLLLITNAAAAQYHIYNRWNIKLSASAHRSNEVDIPFITMQDDPQMVFRPRLNARVECNYGVLGWVEMGAYVGFMRHLATQREVIDQQNQIFAYPDIIMAFAPNFGAIVNFHLLHFWVKKNDCRWELYLTAKYGAAYLVKWMGYNNNYGVLRISYPVRPLWVDPNYSRYRHEFGVGIGGGVYFWNLFGVYFEGMVGQYSFFPDMFRSNFSVRAGIEFKFTSKKTKTKQKNNEDS
jgi:hypothetical protein